jgi:hypothetical protein
MKHGERVKISYANWYGIHGGLFRGDKAAVARMYLDTAYADWLLTSTPPLYIFMTQ